MYLEKFHVNGKIAFITGGGRGIGLAAAEALAEASAHVIISDITDELLASGSAHLREKGYEVDVARLDVTRPEDVAAAAVAAKSKIRFDRHSDSERGNCMAGHTR